jgi:hypothetical protein
MAHLSRPDGIDIHYEERGEGPAVFLAHNPVMSMPSVFERLVADLARDHRVVTWDPRGVGQSTRRGPYDGPTDTDDMAALVEEIGQSGVMISTALNPVPHMLGAKRPELTDVGGGWVEPSPSPRLASVCGCDCSTRLADGRNSRR